jgi:hypothetical protein
MRPKEDEERKSTLGNQDLMEGEDSPDLKDDNDFSGASDDESLPENLHDKELKPKKKVNFAEEEDIMSH